MSEFTSWRDFDLAPRIAKIRGAFNRQPVVTAEEVPVLINTPGYFSFGSLDKPTDYYTSPGQHGWLTRLLSEKHLRLVDDDLCLFSCPGLAQGARIRLRATIRFQRPADDPAVAAPCIQSPKDIARLKLPNPEQDGWMPRVLATIDYARRHGDLP
jgi:hypothetical protein